MFASTDLKILAPPMCLKEDWSQILDLALKGLVDKSALTFEEKEFLRDAMDKYRLSRKQGSRLTVRSLAQDVRFTTQRISAEVRDHFFAELRISLIIGRVDYGAEREDRR